MIKSIVVTAFLLITCTVVALSQEFRGLDQSPLDIAYFPDNFAHDRKPGEKAIIKVTYSRPQKKGREVFGKLEPYGKVWRTGANEATEIKLYQDVTVEGKKLKAGTYSLFTIPDQNEWTIIFNADLDYWGAYSYHPDKDVLRVTVPSKKLDEPVEAFTIQFDKNQQNGAVMKLAWDQTVAEVNMGL